AAYLGAHLEITNTPRPDHAQYLANWLAVLKGDTRAIFTAASLATRAVDYLYGLQPASEQAPKEEPRACDGTPVRPDGETAHRHDGLAARGLRS
ncbi:MAG: zincin-like metallopeptidase domain-containing protein, partial [Hyphomicrobium sp.]